MSTTPPTPTCRNCDPACPAIALDMEVPCGAPALKFCPAEGYVTGCDQRAIATRNVCAECENRKPANVAPLIASLKLVERSLLMAGHLPSEPELTELDKLILALMEMECA